MNIEIFNNSGDVRSRGLEHGAFSVGSDFGCDIVLVDEGIEPRHLEIAYDKDGFTVKSVGDAQACIGRKGAPMEGLSPDEPQAWETDKEVWIGDLVLRRAKASSKSKSGGSKLAKAKIPVIALVAGLGLFVPTKTSLSSVNSALFIAELDAEVQNPVENMDPYNPVEMDAPATTDTMQPKAEDAPTAMTPEPEMVKPVMAAMQSLSIDDATNFLSNAGFIPTSVTELAGKLNADFYVEGIGERDQIQGFLSENSMSVKPSYHVKSQMVSAVNIILNAIAKDARVESLENGVLVLEADSLDDKRREEVQNALLQDVPGLRTVDFSGSRATFGEGVVADTVIGIWYSNDSYLILKDGRTIRPGEKIDDKVTLVTVNSETQFTVIQDENEERITF